MTIPITISSKKNKENKTIETKALLDTGAGEKFIDQNYVNQLKMETQILGHPLKVYMLTEPLTKEEPSPNMSTWN